MGLIQLLVILVIVGGILYVINADVLFPIDGKIKKIINFVAVLVVLLFLLNIFVPGVFGGVKDIRVGG